MNMLKKVYSWITDDTVSSSPAYCECDDCLGIAQPECPDCIDEFGIIVECEACVQLQEDYLRVIKLEESWWGMYQKSPAEKLLTSDLSGRDWFLKYHEEWYSDDDIPF